MTISAYSSIITLKVKTLNSLPKEHKVAEQIIKIKTRPICGTHCPQKTHFRRKATQRLKMKGWKKNIPCKSKP